MPERPTATPSDPEPGDFDAEPGDFDAELADISPRSVHRSKGHPDARLLSPPCPQTVDPPHVVPTPESLVDALDRSTMPH